MGYKKANYIDLMQQREHHAKTNFLNKEIKCKTMYGCGSVIIFNNITEICLKKSTDEGGCFNTYWVECPICGKRLYSD